MFAFGETVERTPKDFASERTRIKKRKVLGTRQSIELIQTKESLVLPNIITTQLTQNCERACPSRIETREAMNGQERKTIQQIAKQGRLRDSTYMLEENGGSRAEELEGLFISKLNFQSGNRDESPELFSSSCEKKRRKQRSRLSKTDSGFCEDSIDETATPLFVDSPNESDKASNTSNSSSSETSPDHTTSNRVSRSEKTRRITMDFKTILNRDNKTVVRNTDRLTTRANMCVQSQQSLHADLVAFKSFTTHNGETSNCTLQTNEHCVKLKEVILKTMRNSFDGKAIKQSDTSLAVLKTRRRLLGKRNSAGPPFPFTERRVNKERVVDMSRATCNCGQMRRVQFSDLERLDFNRQCASCPVDFVASQPIQDRKTPLENENIPDFGCAVSISGLTEKTLLETSQSQETVDVNVKCQEWLNRWLLFNNTPQLAKCSTAVS